MQRSCSTIATGYSAVGVVVAAAAAADVPDANLVAEPSNSEENKIRIILLNNN